MKSFWSGFTWLKLYVVTSCLLIGGYAYAEYYGRDILGRDPTKKESSSAYRSSGSHIHHK